MKNKSRIVYFLQEIAIVVIGVLIAVSIGNYKESVDNEKYIEKTLLAIKNEIKVSHREVDGVVSKHSNLMDSLENKISDNEQSLGEMIGSLGGVQYASIKNISLRFFISNKAQLVDFDMISQLLEIEEQTNILADQMKRMADFVYQNLNEKEDKVKLSFTFFLADVIHSEQVLLKSYLNFLENNKAYLQDFE